MDVSFIFWTNQKKAEHCWTLLNIIITSRSLRYEPRHWGLQGLLFSSHMLCSIFVVIIVVHHKVCRSHFISFSDGKIMLNHVKSSISPLKKVHFSPASGATEATDGRRIASSTLGRTAAAWRQVFGDDALFQHRIYCEVGIIHSRLKIPSGYLT